MVAKGCLLKLGKWFRQKYSRTWMFHVPRYNMTFLMIVCIVAVIISSEADTCSSNQHCSNCNQTTDFCLTDCDPGYYGLKCGTRCSGNCRNKGCKLSTDGIGVCTEGCLTGYQGESCMIPCDSPGGTCTACPGGCDGGYCQLGSSCVSGCVDSYYGTGCKTCSSRCKSCNRLTGECDECEPLYIGRDCNYSCKNCIKQCRYGCVDGCLPGYYGKVCSQACNENCRQNPMVNHTLGIQASTNVNVECHPQNGDCTHGCKDGWHGRQCSSPCSSKCRNRRCNASGDCVDGCAPGYFSTDCKPCPVNCANNSCNSYQEHCHSGCMDGFYGELCDRTCNVCLDGACDQMTGTCFRGCNDTRPRCTTPASCTKNCSIEWCLMNPCEDTMESRGMKIGLSVSFTMLVIGLFLAVVLYCRKRLSPDREPQGHATGQAVAYSAGYSTLHRYWEIKEEDVNMHCEPPVLNEEEPDQDADMDMPVLAEVLQNDMALSTPSHSPASSLSSREDSESYSPLEREEEASDHMAATSYLSPVEDIPEALPNDLT